VGYDSLLELSLLSSPDPLDDDPLDSRDLLPE
jgi:hypothetical protein